MLEFSRMRPRARGPTTDLRPGRFGLHKSHYDSNEGQGLGLHTFGK